ncbi:MAG: hypothetical protein RLZZ453_549 [Chlamydiota bacterium]
MSMAACAQALLSMSVKALIPTVPITIQLLFYYGMPVLFFIPKLLRQNRNSLQTQRFGIHFIRGICSFLSLTCFFCSIKQIPLGLSATLFNTIPFFVPFLAALFLKEKIHIKTYVGLFLALCGVLCILNPKAHGISSGGCFLGLLSAFLMAASMVFLKHLVQKKESITQIVFHQYSSCSLIALVGLVVERSLFPFELVTLLLLVGMGCLSAFIQYCFSKAAQYGPVSRMAPFLYLAVPLSAIWGWVLFGQSLQVVMITGSVLIFIGLCICSLTREILERFTKRFQYP